MRIVYYILILLAVLYSVYIGTRQPRYEMQMTSTEIADLKRGQRIMTDMLKEFDTICRENGLSYWCVGGTLIGAARGGGWIPHDADVDVAMLATDYEKLQKIIQKQLSPAYWFQDNTTDPLYGVNMNIGKIRYNDAVYLDEPDGRIWHNGLQLDIFIFNDNSNGTLTPTRNDMTDIYPISKDMIFPLKELMFEDVNVYVPNKYKEYLTDCWGGYPPPELPYSQQYPHEGRISFTVPEWMKDLYPQLYT